MESLNMQSNVIRMRYLYTIIIMTRYYCRLLKKKRKWKLIFTKEESRFHISHCDSQGSLKSIGLWDERGQHRERMKERWRERMEERENKGEKQREGIKDGERKIQRKRGRRRERNGWSYWRGDKQREIVETEV